MLTCYRCAKIIKGDVIHYVPPLISIQVGADFEKAYHPVCYKLTDEEAEAELSILLVNHEASL